MKPHPRPPYIRKTIKWGGAALTVLLAVVWIGSGWWFAKWENRAIGWVNLASGRLGVWVWRGPRYTGPTNEWAVDSRTRSLPLQWGMGWEFDSWHAQLRLPLWLPTLFFFTGTAAAWRLDTLARRRARMNLCPKCHYDRTGLAGGTVCPECGTGSGTA